VKSSVYVPGNSVKKLTSQGHHVIYTRASLCRDYINSTQYAENESSFTQVETTSADFVYWIPRGSSSIQIRTPGCTDTVML